MSLMGSMFQFSDHKPVTSQFGLAVKKLNRPKQFSICDDRLSSSKTGLKANILYSQISLSTKEVGSIFSLGD